MFSLEVALEPINVPQDKLARGLSEKYEGNPGGETDGSQPYMARIIVCNTRMSHH